MNIHRRQAVLALAVLALCSCASNAKKDSALEPTTYDPAVVAPDAPEPIGKLLVDLDASLRAWTSRVLSAESREEKRTAYGLELDIRRRVKPRVAELIHELETSPAPSNRMTAAAALGFSAAVEAQSPLLNALHDPSIDVVNNALIGLAVLRRADTPLEPLQGVLSDHPDGMVRSNAAWALRSVVEAGAEGASASAVARAALHDSEPFVRGQSALLLAAIDDFDAVEGIADLALDPTPFVRLCASRALVAIGLADPHSKGMAARALAQSYAQAEKELKPALRRALAQLAGGDLGDESKPWLEWAAKMP